MWRREGNHLGLIGSSSERADANTCDEGPLNCEASDFEKKKKNAVFQHMKFNA